MKVEMKVEILDVPKEKNPMDFISELGEKTKNSWIFMHENMSDVLYKKSIASAMDGSEYIFKEKGRLIFNEGYPWSGTKWAEVFRIQSEDIAFKSKSSDPEYVFFLKMTE